MTYIYRPGAYNVTDAGRARIAQPGFSAAGNGLLNNLIAYWPGNEAAGNALDLHTNALHLTDVDTVTSNPGLVYATARQYAIAERHIRLGDDALLSTGDVDFTLAAWCYLDSKTYHRVIASKWATAASGREYMLWFNNDTNRFQFVVRNAGDTANTTAQDDTLGSPSLANWYWVMGWHDAVANSIYITTNNNAGGNAAHAGGVPDTSSAFNIGSAQSQSYWFGRIGPTMFWKSAPGGGGVLTAAQRTALYNAGAGLPYASFTL